MSPKCPVWQYALISKHIWQDMVGRKLIRSNLALRCPMGPYRDPTATYSTLHPMRPYQASRRNILPFLPSRILPRKLMSFFAMTTRGLHKGKTGLVVDINVGGSILFYQTEVQHGKLALVPRAVRQDADKPLLRAPDPMEPKIDDLELDWKDALGADRLVPFREDDSTPSPVAQAEDPWAVLDRKQKARRQEMKDSERWIIGMHVQVIGKHPLKGLRRLVLGYSWLTTRVDYKPDYGQIQLQINIDQRTTRDMVSYKSVVESRSRLPLDQAIILSDTQESLVLHPRPSTPLPPPSPRPVTPAPQDPCYAVYGEPPVLEEFNGRWLLEPSFVGKRIDVRVIDVDGLDFLAKTFSRLAQNIRKPQRDVANQTGYLVPLQRPLQENQLEKDFIGVMCNNKRTVLPIPALIPCRTTQGGQSISDVPDRVIVIGPDVVGSRACVGHYAEVVPGITSWPGQVVSVKFAAERDQWGQAIRTTGTYHLVSLCRARNVPIGGLPATDFNAIRMKYCHEIDQRYERIRKRYIEYDKNAKSLEGTRWATHPPEPLGHGGRPYVATGGEEVHEGIEMRVGLGVGLGCGGAVIVLGAGLMSHALSVKGQLVGTVGQLATWLGQNYEIAVSLGLRAMRWPPAFMDDPVLYLD
ncbi:hypothetical protein C8F01DRAFT_1087985 [Mycena amicta]|nr:hypothetical protein C8F01DRAFT_1087985 [Mycena amicta]